MEIINILIKLIYSSCVVIYKDGGYMVEKISEKYLTLPEVKAILEKYQKDNSTMQTNTLEYARKLSKINAEKVQDILNELMAVVELREETLVQLINIFPESIEEIKSITMYEDKLLKKDVLEKILNILNKYREIDRQ